MIVCKRKGCGATEVDGRITVQVGTYVDADEEQPRPITLRYATCHVCGMYWQIRPDGEPVDGE